MLSAFIMMPNLLKQRLFHLRAPFPLPYSVLSDFFDRKNKSEQDSNDGGGISNIIFIERARENHWDELEN